MAFCVTPLETLDQKWKDPVRTIYEASFPPRQREPFDDIVARTREGRGSGLVAFADSRPVGFATWLLLESAPCAFLEFIAVTTARRGSGFGAALYSAMVEHLRKDGVPRLVFEVEDPAGADGENERRTRERRIAFYLKAGAQVLPVNDYVAPDLSGDGTEHFLLMWQPLSEAAPLTPAAIRELVRALLTEGYGLSPDNPLAGGSPSGGPRPSP